MKSGDIIAQRFRIDQLVGSGGMGSVYQGFDLDRGERVAVKLSRDAGDHEHARRLRREAQALADRLSSLNHPGIVRYIAHGVADSGCPYLIMEWLDGHDLEQAISRAPLSQDDTVELGVQVCSALEAAHDCGVIHRDLKPGNLFLVDGEVAQVKLVDFGLARIWAAPSPLSLQGAIMGTPGYLAPEQARGDTAIDGRTDLYALGAVLFACLTGELPFRGGHVIAILAKQLFGPAPRVSTLYKDVSPQLDDVIDRLLAMEPEHRPSTARQVRALLRACTTGGPAPAHRRRARAVTHGEQRFFSVLVISDASPRRAPALTARRGERYDRRQIREPCEVQRRHCRALGSAKKSPQSGSFTGSPGRVAAPAWPV